MALTLQDFAFVTVMEVEVYSAELDLSGQDPFSGLEPIATLDSLTISNITQEGPLKEMRGGIASEPIIRFRKTVRLDMEDVIARIDSFETLFNANIERDNEDQIIGFGITDSFATSVTLKGKTFVIDRQTGRRQWIEIVFKRFLPDSVFDITMEAEGDIGIVNVAGELFPDECGEYFTVRRIASEECPAEDETTGTEE